MAEEGGGREEKRWRRRCRWEGGRHRRHKKEIKSRSRLAEGVWGYAHIRTGVLDVKVSRGSERRRDALLYPDGDGVTDAR